MKTFKQVCFILIFSAFSFSAISGTSLFTADGIQYPIESLSSNDVGTIAKTIGEGITSHKADNFIFYVHGRREEPIKSLQEVIPPLEKEYTAEVLMFHWFPSYKGPLGYPDKEAQAAAPDLYKALENFQKYKDEHADQFKNVKSTLLLHSMGNMVFGKMMESYKTQSLKKDLFDTVILNSADIDAKGHDEWVKKIDFSNNIYITLNANDKILDASSLMANHEKRLGQKLETITGKKILQSANANYVDFSDTGVNHRYFIKSGQNGNLYLKQFYDSVLNGKPVDLNTFKGVTNIKQGDGNKIFVFKKR